VTWFPGTDLESSESECFSRVTGIKPEQRGADVHSSSGGPDKLVPWASDSS